MANIAKDKLLALINAHLENDDDHFRSLVHQIANKSNMPSGLQAQLRQLMQQPNNQRKTFRHAGPGNENESPLFTTTDPKVTFDDLVLGETVTTQIRQIIEEYENRLVLAEYGLKNAKRLLLIGDPGTGKTSTAAAIANELYYPLYTVRLDSIITRFLGSTTAQLRLVFDQITETDGVYLFDEVDALGSSRDSQHDVGEIRRALNSFLQFLEEDSNENSIIVATTNNPGLLDSALFRRFDETMLFGLPNTNEVIGLIRNELSLFELLDDGWEERMYLARGLSQADIIAAVNKVAKQAVMTSTRQIGKPDLVAVLEERRALKGLPPIRRRSNI